MVDNGRIFQLVTVSVRSPLPVAWIAMGFELDDKAARELADITGLAVTRSVNSGWSLDGLWRARCRPCGARPSDVVTRRIEMSKWGNAEVVAVLSRSLADARAPFERLTKVLFLIAAVSLVASALAAFWLARNITRPLQDLTQAVDQMRTGTYDATLNVQRRDELGVLAEGLQLMQTAVQSRDQSIRRLAYEDSLTGSHESHRIRRGLEPCIDGSRRGADRGRRHQFGPLSSHQRTSGIFVGDAVLIKMAARLAAVPSVESAVARFAADQFAAFTQLQNASSLQGWGTSLVMALADPVFVEAQPIDITATLGLTLAAEGAHSADELMRCADLALEHARREKRALAIYAEALKPAARDQLSLLGRAAPRRRAR